MKTSKNKAPTPVEGRDTALALSFLLLLIWFFSRAVLFVHLALIFLLWAMLLPQSLAPLARSWLGLSRALSRVTSKVLLTVIYAFLVLPAALFRRLVLGKDALRLKQWRGSASAFVVRDHQFGPDDLTEPF